MTKAEILAKIEHVIQCHDRGERNNAVCHLELLLNRLRGEPFTADHPPPTVATSEGPKPRIDLVAEGRPEPDPAIPGPAEALVDDLCIPERLVQLERRRIDDYRAFTEAVRALSTRLEALENAAPTDAERTETAVAAIKRLASAIPGANSITIERK